MIFVIILFCLVIVRYRTCAGQASVSTVPKISFPTAVSFYIFKAPPRVLNFGTFCDFRILDRREKIVETLAVFLTPNAEGQI